MRTERYEAERVLRRGMAFRGFAKGLERQYGQARASVIMLRARDNLAALYRENAAQSEAVKRHTFRMILPAIALYEEMRKSDPQGALRTFEEIYFARMEKAGKAIHVILRIPFLYLAVPGIFSRRVAKVYNEEAGFASRIVKNEPPLALDMLKCPYADTCARYGCPELTRCFCHSDDICYGNMHKNLVWRRTQTLGTGGNLCDFRLFARKGKDKHH